MKLIWVNHLAARRCSLAAVTLDQYERDIQQLTSALIIPNHCGITRPEVSYRAMFFSISVFIPDSPQIFQ